MKLVVSDGRDLRAYDISGPINHLVADDLPIKLHGHFLFEDEKSRKLVRDLAKVQMAEKFGKFGSVSDGKNPNFGPSSLTRGFPVRDRVGAALPMCRCCCYDSRLLVGRSDRSECDRSSPKRSVLE